MKDNANEIQYFETRTGQAALEVDNEHGLFYLHLDVATMGQEGVAVTNKPITCASTQKPMVVLDFDAGGKLIGIEVL